MSSQDRNDSPKRDDRDNERMATVIDQAKGLSAQDLQGHEAEARVGGERIRRAVDQVATGNTPHGGDDPQHLAGNTRRTPMPNETGGKGRVGDTPVKKT